MFNFLKNGFNSVIDYTLGRQRKRRSEEMISHFEGVPGAKRAAIDGDLQSEPLTLLEERIDLTTNDRSVSDVDSDSCSSSFVKRSVYSDNNQKHRVRPIIKVSRRLRSDKSESRIHQRIKRSKGDVEALHTSWALETRNGTVENGDTNFLFTKHFSKAQTSTSFRNSRCDFTPQTSVLSGGRFSAGAASFSSVTNKVETLSAERENGTSGGDKRFSWDVKRTNSVERKWNSRNGNDRALGKNGRKTGNLLRSPSKDDDDDDDDLLVTGVEFSKDSCVPKSADFEKLISQCRYTETDWLTTSKNKSRSIVEENFRKADALQKLVKECEQKRSVWDSYLSTRVLRYLRLTSHEPTPVPDIYYEPEDEEEELPVITAKMRERVTAAFSCPPNTVLRNAFRLEVTVAELATLRPRQWLSDMIINFYMQLIAERSSKKKGTVPSCHPMSTFFYPKLLQSGYAGIKRWTRRIDIFEFDLVLVPIHLGQHWCFALIQMKDRKISYFDSMQQPNNECLSQLLNYLIEEMKEKKGETLDVNTWSVENAKNIPVQRNGYDCGVFTCQFAEYLSRRAALTFSQNDMTYFRERMMYEILEMTLLI